MTKEEQRAALRKAVWRIANDQRGSVDGWDFKQYVLGILFYRYISENLPAYLNEHERRATTSEFDYATLADADAESPATTHAAIGWTTSRTQCRCIAVPVMHSCSSMHACTAAARGSMPATVV